MNNNTCLVTVTFNSADFIDGFINSFVDLDESIHLFIFDNSSTDNTLEKIKKWDHPRIIVEVSETNLGVAAGNNAGINFAHRNLFEYICLINNDTEFPKNIIEYLKKHLVNADIVTPKIVYYDNCEIIWAAGGKYSFLKGGSTIHIGDRKSFLDKRYNQYYYVKYTPTCCVMMRSELFKDLGNFDEAYFVYFDDTDFMIRATRHKKTVLYCPEVTIKHKISSSTGGNDSSFTLRYSVRNHIIYLRKNFNVLTRIPLMFMAILFFIYKAVKIAPHSSTKAGIIVKSFIEGTRFRI